MDKRKSNPEDGNKRGRSNSIDSSVEKNPNKKRKIENSDNEEQGNAEEYKQEVVVNPQIMMSSCPLKLKMKKMLSHKSEDEISPSDVPTDKKEQQKEVLDPKNKVSTKSKKTESKGKPKIDKEESNQPKERKTKNQEIQNLPKEKKKNSKKVASSAEEEEENGNSSNPIIEHDLPSSSNAEQPKKLHRSRKLPPLSLIVSSLPPLSHNLSPASPSPSDFSPSPSNPDVFESNFTSDYFTRAPSLQATSTTPTSATTPTSPIDFRVGFPSLLPVPGITGYRRESLGEDLPPTSSAYSIPTNFMQNLAPPFGPLGGMPLTPQEMLIFSQDAQSSQNILTELISQVGFMKLKNGFISKPNFKVLGGKGNQDACQEHVIELDISALGLRAFSPNPSSPGTAPLDPNFGGSYNTAPTQPRPANPPAAANKLSLKKYGMRVSVHGMSKANRFSTEKLGTLALCSFTLQPNSQNNEEASQLCPIFIPHNGTKVVLSQEPTPESPKNENGGVILQMEANVVVLPEILGSDGVLKPENVLLGQAAPMMPSGSATTVTPTMRYQFLQIDGRYKLPKVDFVFDNLIITDCSHTHGQGLKIAFELLDLESGLVVDQLETAKFETITKRGINKSLRTKETKKKKDEDGPKSPTQEPQTGQQQTDDSNSNSEQPQAS